MKSIQILLLLLLPSFVFQSTAILASELEADFSGYARVVGGILNDQNAEYFGYGDSIEFEQDSLLGAQAKVKLNDQLSLTGLGLFHTNPNRDSGVEWLYLSYRPTKALNLKVGQMQTPFYSLSDTLDVGYSYPWVIAPREVYNDFVFTKFQGIDLRYAFVNNDFSAHIETYYGQIEDHISVNNQKRDTKVKALTGLIGELRVDNFHTRVSYHTGRVTPKIPEVTEFAQILSFAGFQENADALDIENEKVNFFQLSFNYESLDYLLKAEWINIKTDPLMFPSIRGYYLTYGHYFGDFTALITYGNRSDSIATINNQIPLGLSTELDQLYFGFQTTIDNRTKENTESLALGIRWDFSDGMAFKAEYKFLESAGGNQESFNVINPTSFDNKANLLVVALEWVF